MASKSSDFLSSQDPLQNPQTEETPSQESVQNPVIWFEETLETEEKLSQESVRNAAIEKEETLETDADRISDLPEPILLHILSFLPSTEEAARTSILSKRWQFLWISVPSRKFMHYCENCEFRTCQIDNHTSLAISNVKRILNEYTENPELREFSIWFTYEDDEFRDQVDEFVRFAVDRNVEELTVSPRDEFWRDEYDLPEYVFENSMLTSLSLHYVSLNPIGEISWRNLKKLVLGFAGLSDDLVQKILRGSPGLECLEFELCYGVEQMNITSASVKRLVVHNCHVDDMNRPVVYAINAPHVLSLRVSGFSSLERLLLVDVGSVVKATVELRMGFTKRVDEIEELWREILQDLQHTRELRMSAECVMVLNKIWRKGLRSPPLKCKCLRIQSFIRRSCFLGLVSLLESAPDLETLIINADPPFSSVVPCGFHDIINHLAYQTMSFKCLKTVEIAYLMEWDYECEIIKFLLKHGCVLETMIISVASTDGKQAVSMSRQVSHKLLGFECASRDVMVLFKQINEDTLHRLKAHYDFCLDPNIYILNGNEDYDFDLW